MRSKDMPMPLLLVLCDYK